MFSTCLSFICLFSASLIICLSAVVHGRAPSQVVSSVVLGRSLRANNHHARHVKPHQRSYEEPLDGSTQGAPHLRRHTAHLVPRCGCSSHRGHCRHNKKSKSRVAQVGTQLAVGSTFNPADASGVSVTQALAASSDAGAPAAANTTGSQDQAEKAPSLVKVGLDTHVDTVVGSKHSAQSQEQHVGDATYYGTGLGACGQTSTDSSMIVAVSHLLFDSFPGATGNPNNNPICGRRVRATYQGKSVEVEIVDRCQGCAVDDLDFSPAAFQLIGATEVGRLHGMTWQWL